LLANAAKVRTSTSEEKAFGAVREVLDRLRTKKALGDAVGAQDSSMLPKFSPSAAFVCPAVSAQQTHPCSAPWQRQGLDTVFPELDYPDVSAGMDTGGQFRSRPTQNTVAETSG
jgi:hypothetical protein